MKKGFTLIELLAVIIILAIIALIATPIVLDVVDDARTSVGRTEATTIYKGINQYCATMQLKSMSPTGLEEDDIDCSGKTTFTEEEISKMVELGNSKVDKITYSNNEITELEVTSNGHKYTLCPNGTFAMDDEECSSGGDVALVGSPIEEKAKELVYEDGACKTDGTTYQYMGGCYIKGNPDNNYIWYSGFLWRIMGINEDGTIRMITEDNVTVIPWGASNTAQDWDGSHAKDWLNNYFYPRLKGNNIIVEQTWCSDTTTSSSSARTECTTTTQPAKIGLIAIDEYNLAGGTNSYLDIAQNQWTMTPYSSSKAWDVDFAGNALNNTDVSIAGGLRAVINVNTDVTITGGNGTLGETWSSEAGPYILNEDKSIDVTGKLNEEVTSGEYVLFAGKKYRVVDKDSNGNVKLILDGYYEATPGTAYTMSYGSSNTFSTETGIGNKLNGDVLEWLVASSDTANRNKLVEDYTWYQNNFAYGNSYTVSLEEGEQARSIAATVGLIRIGEMLSNQSSSILTKGYTTASSYSNATSYWTMTPYTSSSGAWYVSLIGNVNPYSNSVSNTYGLRAVIIVNSDVTITGGNGTWSNPYEI